MITDELIMSIDALERDIAFNAIDKEKSIYVYVGHKLYEYVNLIFPDVTVKYIVDEDLNDYQYKVIVK